jgi:hypothetical protein
MHIPVSGFAYVSPVYADMFLVSVMMFLDAAEMFLFSAETPVDEKNSNSNREGTNIRDTRESREETTAERIHQQQA